MAERALRLRLGLFVGGSLIALAGLVVLFGGTPQLFSSDAKYAVLFPEAPGIGPGTPIRKSGVRIGQVTALELDPVSGQVRVRIAVDKKFLPRQSEDATITRGLLSGDTAVDFLPRLDAEGKPVPRGDEWPPGSEIPGVPPITPRSLLNPASSALANAQQQLDRITKTFERFEQAAPRIERAADEAADLFKEVRGFIPELRRTNQRLQNLIGGDLPPPGPGGVVPIGFVANAAQPDAAEPNIRALIRDAQEALRGIRPAIEDFRVTMRKLEPDLTAAVRSARQAFDSANEVLSPDNRKEIAELLKNLNAVSANIIKFAVSLNAVLDTADKTLKNIDTQVTQVGLVVGDVRAVTRPLAARSENLVKSVADSAEELSKLLVEIRGVVGAFAKENGTVQKLITDPTVYRNLDDAAASLARILARSEKITRDLEVFADKVARRPELIGVGGALRPSAGLKDLPGAPSYRPDWPPASSARPFAGPGWLAPPDGPLPPVQGTKP
ncbi:MAG: MCE family protein [Planctomycetes bacterium]|nr:MCE family protein [Planctomycetota bacterium]